MFNKVFTCSLHNYSGINTPCPICVTTSDLSSAKEQSATVAGYNFACGSCENCRFIYQDDDDKKSESGVCSLFTDKQYFEEEKVEINNKCEDIGAIGVGEDGWAYGYFWIYKIKEFGCIKFESKQKL